MNVANLKQILFGDKSLGKLGLVFIVIAFYLPVLGNQKKCFTALGSSAHNSVDLNLPTKVRFRSDTRKIMATYTDSFYEGDVTSLAMRELIQNSIDAIRRRNSHLSSVSKDAQESNGLLGTIKSFFQNRKKGGDDSNKVEPITTGSEKHPPGAIHVFYDFRNKRIIVEDNGIGMDLDVISNAFFRLGGTDKGAGEMGGYGVAKGMLYAISKKIFVSTVKDGLKHEFTIDSIALQTNPDEYEISVKSSKAEENEEGTLIVLDLNSDVKSPEYIYQIGLIGSPSYVKDINMTFSDNDKTHFWQFRNESLYDSVFGLELPDRKKFAKIKKLMKELNPHSTQNIFKNAELDDSNSLTNHLDFDFATIDIMVARDKALGGFGRHSLLNNGLWQNDLSIWDHEFRKKIPYDIVINIKPKVKPDHPRYPFDLTRSGFRPSVQSEYKQVVESAISAFYKIESEAIRLDFSRLVNLPLVNLQDRLELALQSVPPVEYLDETEPVVRIDNDVQWAETVVSFSNYPEGLPFLRNNHDIDYSDLPDALSFFSEMAGIIVLTKNRLILEIKKSDPDLAIEMQKYRPGIFIDEDVFGTNWTGGINAIAINPLVHYESRQISVLAESIAGTIIHELTHVKVHNHDEEFTTLQKFFTLRVTEDQFFQALKMLIEETIKNHRKTFIELMNRFEKIKARKDKSLKAS